MLFKAKLIVLQNLAYSGQLTSTGLGISCSMIDLVLESLLEEKLIEVNGKFIKITEDGLALC